MFSSEQLEIISTHTCICSKNLPLQLNCIATCITV